MAKQQFCSSGLEALNKSHPPRSLTLPHQTCCLLVRGALDQSASFVGGAMRACWWLSASVRGSSPASCCCAAGLGLSSQKYPAAEVSESDGALALWRSGQFIARPHRETDSGSHSHTHSSASGLFLWMKHVSVQVSVPLSLWADKTRALIAEEKKWISSLAK